MCIISITFDYKKKGQTFETEALATKERLYIFLDLKEVLEVFV